MIENMTHTCDFSFVKTDENTWDVTYDLENLSDHIVISATKPYTPRTLSPADNNEARSAIRQWLRAMFKIWYGVANGVKFTCTNPASDFLTRGEKIAKTRATMRVFVQPTVTPVVHNSNNPRVFEVVQVGKVWTIIRHESELLSEQEAKTQMFAHIVNGD